MEVAGAKLLAAISGIHGRRFYNGDSEGQLAEVNE